VAVVGSLVAVPIGLAWGLEPAVAASFVALALVSAVVAWLAPGMVSDWLPWVLLTASLATVFLLVLPDRQLRATHLTFLAAIAVAGVVLPAAQVLVFAVLAVAAEGAFLLAIGGMAQTPNDPGPLAAAGISLSIIVATAAALGASGMRRALGEQMGRDARAREAEVRSEEHASAFRLLAACTSDLVFLVGPDGQVRYASPSADRLFGAGLPAIVGGAFTDRVLEADRPRAVQMVE